MKKPLIISALCIMAAAALLLWGFRTDESAQSAQKPKYLLLIESDTGSFVMQLRKGAEQRAGESGARLQEGGAGVGVDAEGVAGVILWMKNPEAKTRELQALGLPVVVVGSEIKNAACVLADYKSTGEQLMSYALEVREAGAVTLISDNIDEAARARSGAAFAVAAKVGADILAYADGMSLPERCEIAVAMSARATSALAAMKRDGRFNGLVAGVDVGDNRVEALESGDVCAMALESPYAMGYLALKRLEELQGGADADESALTSVLVATKDNMYLAQNVKQVFPLLQ